MADLKLSYFDAPRSRGEECRLALHLAGVDWEDDRVRGDWAERKPSAPFGALPLLDVTGKGVLSQSNAILEYVGRGHGLLPTDSFESARHVAIMNAVEDLRWRIASTSRDDEAAKKAAREALASGQLVLWAESLSREVRGPFVGGDEISVADIKLYVALGALREGAFDHLPTDVFDAFPPIVALLDAVAAHPKVKEWSERNAQR